MQLALETKVDSLRGEINSMKHQLTTSQETMDAEKAELQRELESAQQRLTLLQTQSEAQKVCICTYLYVYIMYLYVYVHCMYICICVVAHIPIPIFRDVSLGPSLYLFHRMLCIVTGVPDAWSCSVLCIPSYIDGLASNSHQPEIPTLISRRAAWCL